MGTGKEQPAPGCGTLALSTAASLLATALVLGCGVGLLFVLAVAMNGFSEAEATPVFVGAIALVMLANAGVVAVLSVAITRALATGDLRAWTVVFGNALLCTLLPAGYVLWRLVWGGGI